MVAYTFDPNTSKAQGFVRSKPLWSIWRESFRIAVTIYSKTQSQKQTTNKQSSRTVLQE